jgi:organic hydroperoxide reductase OsmC/OhrA
MTIEKTHLYKTTVTWNGNKGSGTSNYVSYGRDHIISIQNKINLLCSSDPHFRGDPTKHNPEELLLASLSSCHMLWYLHLCAQAGVIVVDYIDHATAFMHEYPNGSGKFAEATLHPIVTVTHQSMEQQAIELHHKANKLCFIANSVNFPVHHQPEIKFNE